MASPCIAWLFGGVGVKKVGTCASPWFSKKGGYMRLSFLNQGEAHVPTFFTPTPLNNYAMQGEAMQPCLLRRNRRRTANALYLLLRPRRQRWNGGYVQTLLIVVHNSRTGIISSSTTNNPGGLYAALEFDILRDQEPCTVDRGCRIVSVEIVVLLSNLLLMCRAGVLQSPSITAV